MWRHGHVSWQTNIVAEGGKQHLRVALALLAALVVIGVTLVVAGVATVPRVASPAQLRSAQVVSVNGQVVARLQGKEIQLHAGDTIPAGWQVVTSVGARCELEVPGPARITLGPTSAIVVAPGAALRSSQGEKVRPALRVDVGTVLVHVLKGVRRLVDFSVETPTAVAGVRGTMFDVRVAPSGTTQVSVWEGQVAVHKVSTQKLQSNPVVITAGEAVVVQKTTNRPAKQPQAADFAQRWQSRQGWLQEQKQWEKEALSKAKNQDKGKDQSKKPANAPNNDPSQGLSSSLGNDWNQQTTNHFNASGGSKQQAKVAGKANQTVAPSSKVGELFVPPGNSGKTGEPADQVADLFKPANKAGKLVPPSNKVSDLFQPPGKLKAVKHKGTVGKVAQRH